jgi:ABC-2 type transport system permease protein
MTRLIAAELIKLRTTRTFWWLCLAAAALPILIVVITLATDSVRTYEDARSLLGNIGIAGLFMTILGVVGAAGEYRHGTVTSTFLVAPDRRRVIVAKGIAHGLGGLFAGAATTTLVLAISIPWLSTQGHSLGVLSVGGGDVVAIAAGSIAYVALAAILGVAFGSLVTSQVAAVVVVLIVIFVVDPAVAALVHGYERFSLQGLGLSMSGDTSETAGNDLFAPGVAALVYLGYAAVLMAAAALVVPERDVG